MEAATKKQILDRFRGMGRIGKKNILEKVPLGERRYKCFTCFTIVDESPCPNCGETHLQILCPLDHCHCGHDLITSIAYCELCGDVVCPECGCHDVLGVSRVTGYLQDIGGFNNAKRAELKDRTRYNIAVGGIQ